MNLNHPFHDAGTLQAKQKFNHCCEIKPVQERNLWGKITRTNGAFFMLLIAALKTRPVLKTAWKGKGVQQGKGPGVMMMFPNND